MIVAEVLKSPEIKPGLLVVFKNPADPEFDGDSANREWQRIRFEAYRRPLKVRLRIGNHVILVDPKVSIDDPENPGKNDIHFGSTADPSLSVGHVELYQGHQ